MILDLKKGSHPNRTFYAPNAKANFHTTNFIFKKSKPTQEIEVNCLPNFRSLSHRKDVSPTRQNWRATESISIDEPTQLSCTTFMKSYVEKLKKERKRQNKKTLIAKINKERTERDSLLQRTNPNLKLQQIPLCKMHRPNQILILEKVNHNGQRANLNTISLVSQEIASHSNHSSRSCPRTIGDDPSIYDSEKIYQIIKGIRESRKKVASPQDIYGVADLNLPKMPTLGTALYNDEIGGKKLPQMRKTSWHRRTGDKSRKKVSQQQFSIRDLQPWRHQKNYQQFSIEQYDHGQ